MTEELTNAVESEVARLKAALAAAERAMREANRVGENAIRARDAAEARVRELEVEVKAERDSVREFSRKTRAAESECATLRAELDMQRRRADHHQGAAEQLRDRLAAASALLAECYHYQNRLPQDCVQRLRAYLANRPAAPRTDADREQDVFPGMPPAGWGT